MRAVLWFALLVGQTILLQVMMSAQIAGGRIRHIDISRGRKWIGIGNKICGSIGETGKLLLPLSEIENGFGGSFCQSIVF